MPGLDGGAGFAPVGGVGGDADFGESDEEEDRKQKAEGGESGETKGFEVGEGLRVEAVFDEEDEEDEDCRFEGEEEEEPEEGADPLVVGQEALGVQITDEEESQTKGEGKKRGG